jgi:hypothetical protein
MKKLLAVVVPLVLMTVGLIVGPAAFPAGAADHLDAPFVKKDGRIDINDVYVFHPRQSGEQRIGKTVFAMTVNPAAGVISGKRFRPEARYDFLIDTNNDAQEDIVVRVRFSEVQSNGSQRVTVQLMKGNQERTIAQGNTEQIIKGRQDTLVFAGLRDDPFFFDLNSFNDGATFCQAGDSNFFAGLNTSAIVIQVPTEIFGDHKKIGVWGRTTLPDKGQVERMGRPAILTVFIPPNPFEDGNKDPGNLEDKFNFGKPKDDQANFRAEIVNSLTLLFSLNDASGDDPSDDAAKIKKLADVLLPDILTVDLSKKTGFLNGRNLADDVIDAELNLITEGAITTDCVNNDSTFLGDFPYLGVPN